MSVRRVADALAEGRALGLDRLDTQLLLGQAMGRARTWLLAHDDAVLSAPAAAAWDALAARRAGGEPLAYLVGTKEFRGLELAVGPEVLVPRPETELLVERGLVALQARAPRSAAPRLLDLGTGSGAVALALKAACPAARVCASDASPAALVRARANGERLGLAVEWRVGSWWAPWAGERFDLVVSNPPYVAAGDAYLAALRHEPREALVAGRGGLEALRTIAARCCLHLENGAWIWLEHGHDQGHAVRALLQGAGLTGVTTAHDLAGRPRCSGGRHL
jgi:release factor glutamine methyltransferase